VPVESEEAERQASIEDFAAISTIEEAMRAPGFLPPTCTSHEHASYAPHRASRVAAAPRTAALPFHVASRLGRHGEGRRAVGGRMAFEVR